MISYYLVKLNFSIGVFTMKKLLSSLFVSAAISLGGFTISQMPANAATKTETTEKMSKKDKKKKKEAAGQEKMAKDININTASQTQLEKINGIGKTLAKAIIDYRKTNGKFKSVDDLKNVKGIGPKVIDKIKAQATV